MGCYCDLGYSLAAATVRVGLALGPPLKVLKPQITFLNRPYTPYIRSNWPYFTVGYGVVIGLRYRHFLIYAKITTF